LPQKDLKSLFGKGYSSIQQALLGPDPDPNGLYIHYGIDFLGMVIHVFGAAGIVLLYNHFTSNRI
jgi:hypothetical protein